MKTKKTQYEWVENILIREGVISRNFCLQNFVSRLSAIMLKLKKEGYVFDTKQEKGDYVYYLTGEIQPKKLESIYVDGTKVSERIIRI